VFLTDDKLKEFRTGNSALEKCRPVSVPPQSARVIYGP